MSAGAPQAAQPNGLLKDSRVVALLPLVLVGIAVIFELLGWTIRHQSFLGNPQLLLIMILQVSVTGLLAIGVTQVILRI